jgi:hypothetical protein
MFTIIAMWKASSSILLAQGGIRIIDAAKYLLLIPAYVGATVGVLVGVYREDSPKLTPPQQRRGRTLLLWSLGVELISGVLVFAADGTVSHVQESTIKQLVSRRELSAVQKEHLAVVAKQFPSRPFFAMTNPEAEPWYLALDISAELKNDGWDWLSWPNPGALCPLSNKDGQRSCEGVTITDGIEIHVHPDDEALGRALVDALKDPTVLGMGYVRAVSVPGLSAPIIIIGSKQ